MSVATLISGFLLAICLAVQVFAAALQSASDQPYSLFGTEAAVKGPGGIYTRMVGHKTVLLNRDGTEVVGEAIASPNESFEAAEDFITKTIVVRKIEWHEKWGQQRDYWQMKGDFELLGLADDGEHLVAGTRGVYPLPPDYRRDQVMFRFFKRAGLVGQITLGQLIQDFSRLERLPSGYRWGRYLGLNRAGHFVVETVEGRKIPFDVRTGRVMTFESSVRTVPFKDWKTYQDVMRCYEFCYPADYTLEERLGYQETATGDTVLKSSKVPWAISTQAEEQYRESAKSSFEEFAVERAKLMFQTDGPDSSTYASGIVDKRIYRNRNGLEVLTFSVSVVTETSDEDGKEQTTEKETKGPLYVVSISQPADQRHQALFFQLQPGSAAVQGAKQLIEEIADTVKVLR